MKIIRLTPTEVLAQMQPLEESNQFGELLTATFDRIQTLSIVAGRSLSSIGEQVSASINAQGRKWLIGMTLKELANLSLSVIVCRVFVFSVRLVGFESFVQRPRNRSDNFLRRSVDPSDDLRSLV